MKLLILILAIFTTSLLSASAQQPASVLDITGNPLLTRANYYILPVIRGRGGGLTLASTANRTCPLSVFQERNEVERGLPLTFRPVNTTRGAIRVSTDLNIIFSSSASTCIQSNVWRLDYDDSIGQYVINGNGVAGNPGRGTISNWFKIEVVDVVNHFYKLVFCPTVCDTCRPICGDLGVTFQDERWRLVLGGDVSFMVMFGRS